MEALRYPDRLRRHHRRRAGELPHASTDLGAVGVSQAVHRDAASDIPPAKYPAIHQAALDACDARDGVKDGLIDDSHHLPNRSKGARVQGHGLEVLPYSSAGDRRAAHLLASRESADEAGDLPGTSTRELNWDGAGSPDRSRSARRWSSFQYVSTTDPMWDPRTIEFDSGRGRRRQSRGGRAERDQPESEAVLRPRRQADCSTTGGTINSSRPLNSVNYYRSLVSTVGPAIASSVRLFTDAGDEPLCGRLMVEHVRSYESDRAVGRAEAGAGPDRGIALDGGHRRSHAAAPARFPKVARYTGTGSTDEAVNFVCRMPQ
jgi:feruloyl esterase